MERERRGYGGMSREDVLARWPCVTAHLIADSLGYATPEVAAAIILDALNGRENHCEWVASTYKGSAIRAVQKAIRDRRYHKGTMADFPTALAIVKSERDKGFSRMFASWF